MVRYAKQRKRYDCLPTNILNAAKWAGKKVTFKHDFERIKSQLCVGSDGHASWDDGHKVLRAEIDGFAKIVRCVSGPSVNEFYKFVSHPDHAVILSFHPDHEIKNYRYVYHDVLVIGYSAGVFTCLNFRRGPVESRVSIEEMASNLSPDHGLYHRMSCATALFLSKGDCEDNSRTVTLDFVGSPGFGYTKVGPFQQLEYGDMCHMGGLPYVTGSNVIGKSTIELGHASIMHPSHIEHGYWYRFVGE